MGYGMPIPYIISVGTNDDELLDFAISINFGDHLVGCIMLHLILLGKSPLLVSGTSPLKTKSRRRKRGQSSSGPIFGVPGEFSERYRYFTTYTSTGNFTGIKAWLKSDIYQMNPQQLMF